MMNIRRIRSRTKTPESAIARDLLPWIRSIVAPTATKLATATSSAATAT
jgi:hypothetical protein